MLYPPRPDELLSSWIIRNSVAHGSDPMGWVYGFWGEWRAWTRDIDRDLPGDKAARLARFSRLSPETIRAMTLAPAVERMLGKTPGVNQAWPWVIPTGRRNRSVVGGLQFCPECLQGAGSSLSKTMAIFLVHPMPRPRDTASGQMRSVWIAVLPSSYRLHRARRPSVPPVR